MDADQSQLCYVAWPGSVSDDDILGGKALGLLKLTQAGLPVPEWFLVRRSAFDACLKHSGIGTRDPSIACGDRLDELEIAPAVQRELEAALKTLCPSQETVAVRSSAVEEDSAAKSYAGQFESYLFVAPTNVPDNLRNVWRSGYARRVANYRTTAKVSSEPGPPVVIVQRQIVSEVSGVAFSADPVSGRRGHAAVAAVHGVGKPLVSGGSNADTWHVDRDDRVTYRQSAGGEPTSDGVADVVLNEDQVREVAALARHAERVFQRPQDIEWTMTKDRLFILQSRPITTLSGVPDPDGSLTIWDSTNIAENYGGVTTPLTYSFALIIYQNAYRAFCREMGVSARTILAHDDVFRRLIGLIRGRLYYNMLNWYRVLTLLPGYKWNRGFLEQMLGVDEALSQSLDQSLVASMNSVSGHERWVDFLCLTKIVLRLAAGYAVIGSRIRRFLKAIDDLLEEETDAANLRSDELAERYRHLEKCLKPYAGTPTLNDFWLMVFHGVLHRRARAWFGPDGNQLCTDLLSGDHESLSRRIRASIDEMARLAKQDRGFVVALGSEPFWKLRKAMQLIPDFDKAFRHHIERYGDRVPGELKLESQPLSDNPLPLARAVARSAANSTARAETGIDPSLCRQTAEAEIKRVLANAPIRRLMFQWLLTNTRERLRQREALRFCRTRIFGLARSLMQHFGRRFWALDLLEDPRDVLYLEVDEVLAFAEGRAVATDLRGLVEVRQREFQQYQSLPQPPVRFVTHDIPYLTHAIITEPENESWQGDSLTGIGCSSGVVQGTVRAVDDPATAEFQKGDIVLTHRTDPGWVTLLPAAGGLLVEIGNPLSHTAIIAREIGLPMIASVPQLRRLVRDGDLVRMDGRTGTITRLSGEPT